MKGFTKSVMFSQNVVSNVLILAFLIFNLVVRFCTIFYYPPYNGAIAGFFGLVVSCCIFVVFFPKYLRAFLFIFGFSFFLFGFGSIDIQSRVFELIVTCVATTLFVINHRARETHRLNRRLVVLILCYAGVSLFSLLLLPVRQIIKDLWFFGFPDSLFYLLIGPPYGFYYPVAGVVRLILFVVLAVQLSANMIPTTQLINVDSKGGRSGFESRTTSLGSLLRTDSWTSSEAYRSLFAGIFSGAVFCSFIGLLDLYGIISLAWYRFGTTVTPGVLHSTFQNRNCFSEFVLTVIPFVMIGFMSKIKGAWWKISLFGSLVICGIALILAGGRAGWVSYPLILFVCWLFFYFSKEGRVGLFNLRWRDFVKVAVSVPGAVGLMFLLIFYVLMPLSDALKEKANLKGIYMGSEEPTRLFKGQAERIAGLDVADRGYAWGQGFNVGRESPVFGMGYESFLWHANILTKIPESYFDKFLGESQFFDSPHNVFFSIFVSGGVVGVCLWVFII
jgi:O-antigen ligase